MNNKRALEKLDAVISKSRVEMYKPIQVAEALHAARRNSGINLDLLETYRTQSKQLRDAVTKELFGKVSTSSAKFQDDIWSESAVPPEAMKCLGEMNKRAGEVEEYIYQNVWKKSSFLILIREHLDEIENIQDLISVFDAFAEDGMRTSADRLFEIFVLAVLQSDLLSIDAEIKIEEKQESLGTSSVERVIQSVQSSTRKLGFARIGHTNAADAGLDIWSNFGAIVSVKNYRLDEELVGKVLEDTPIGELVIACESYSKEAANRLKNASQKRSITIVTKAELMKDAERLLNDSKSASVFLNIFITNFDHEFPRNSTLEIFMNRRGYKLQNPLHGNWSK